MIPQRPEILKAPLVVDGEKNILPETTPQGSNQFSLLGGFPTLTSLPVNAGGLPPKRLDFNAVFNLLSIHTFFLQSGNKYSWSSELDYSIGGVVLASNNSIYFCIKANGATPPNTVQDPVTSTGYWVELVNSEGTVNINLIADGAVSTNKIADGAVTSTKIANGTIVNADIANTTITGEKLVNDTITATQIAANAITASELANNAVTNAKIANGAVTQEKLSVNIVGNLPVGFIYFQLRGQSTPDQLFATSGKWQDISSTYAGRFFRAAGGAAAGFGNQQAGGLPNISGSLNANKIPTSQDGAFTIEETIDSGGIAAGGYQNCKWIFNASKSNPIYGASTEVRPINETIRVWKKIA